MHPRPPGDRLDLLAEDASPAPNAGNRPWLGVWFSCANRYVRVYRSPDAPFYLARCPKCGDEVRFRVGANGTRDRFFEVRC